MIWNFDMALMPIDTPVLAFLAEELIGSRIHTAQRMRVVNGDLLIVATLMGSDAPQILAWRPMVDNPKEEAVA